MRVIYPNKPKTMRFEDIKVGDTFKYDDMPFIKVTIEAEIHILT